MQPPARCSNHRCVYIDQCDCGVQVQVALYSGLPTSVEPVVMNDTKNFVSPNDSQSETTDLVICPNDIYS